MASSAVRPEHRTNLRKRGTGNRSLLAFPQPDRSIPSMNQQQISAPVEFAANLVFANLAFGRYRHIEIDVAVAGVQIYVCGKVLWNFQRDRAIAAFQPPPHPQS